MMSLNKFMHPRNRYKHKKPDFKHLAAKYPEFEKHATKDTVGNVYLDFKKPEALRVLAKTLLKEDFDLEVDLPADRLVPTIPQKLNYIHWIEDMIGGKKDNVRGIDIGTGASCIYPILCCRMNSWSFLATEVDPQNAHFAMKNVEKNHMSNMIEVRKVSESAMLLGVIGNTEEQYDFCMCNPPFFASHLDAQAILSTRSDERTEPMSVSTASPQESIVPGGEVAFIKQMIDHSLDVRDQVSVFTSMVGKKGSLPLLKEHLRRMKIPRMSTTEFCQGKTMRWGIAWSFNEQISFPKSKFQSSKKEKIPLSYHVPHGAADLPYEIPDLTQYIKTLLDELKIKYKTWKISKGFSGMCFKAMENTWANQRRKKRQKMRDESFLKQTEQSGKSEEVSENVVRETIVGREDGSASVSGEVCFDQREGAAEIVPEQKESTNAGSAQDIEDAKRVNEEKVGQSVRMKRKNGSDEMEKDAKRVKSDDDNDQELPTRSNGGKIVHDDKITADDIKAVGGDDGRPDPADLDFSRNAEDHSEASTSIHTKKETADTEKYYKQTTEYILKCDLKLKKVAEDIVMEMFFIDGQGRELMHQVLQYLKNRLLVKPAEK